MKCKILEEAIANDKSWGLAESKGFGGYGAEGDGM